MDIKLNFINHSNDHNNAQVVIFSRNVAVDLSEVAIAWTVIQNCGQGWNHPFNYPLACQAAFADAYGNYSPQLSARPGDAFAVVETTSGDGIQLTGASASPEEIEMANQLQRGAVSAMIFRDGRLFAGKTVIAPGQKAVFQFKPTIWIGVASQVQQGEVINAAVLSAVNTEISLLGLASADIVMTGGGPGPDATPFTFTLQNIVMA